MRGSVLVTFDEFINDRGVDAVVLYVNNVVRKVQNTDSNRLWTVPINTGDVVKVEVVFSGDYNIDIDVNRIDYTTDDNNGDFGIKNTYITGITGSTAPPFYVEFTATTRPDSYSYRYVVDCTTNANCLNIGIGFNQGFIPFGSYAVREVKLINGKIYCMGNFGQYQGVTSNSFIVLENDGSIDPTFPLNVMSTNGAVGSIEQQSDGKVLLGGSFSTYSGTTTNGIVRINNNFTRDFTFVTGTGFSFPSVFDLEIQPDGKILAGGSFTSYNGTTIRNICRLNSNGSLDTSFSGNTNTSGGSMVINDISLYPDGKMLISGDFRDYNNVSNADKIIRLNSNGSIDTSFTSPFVGPIGYASSVLTTEILSDGKIMIGGTFDFPISGSTSYGLARLNSDGSLDTTFTTDTYFDSESVTDFYVLPNGKILMLVTGTVPENGLYRLNSDGTIDNTFNPVLFDQTFLNTQESIAVTGDGDIIIGGGFTTVNGNTYRRIFKCTEDGILIMCTGLEIQLMTELSESITAENEDNLIINL